MKRQQCLWIGALAILLLSSTASLWGQATASASLQGTVADKSGAVINKAGITLISKETGVTRTTKPNDAGEYRFDPLPIGIYTIKVTAAGFATAEAKDVEVQVGRATTQNFSLAPGAVTETIEVTGAAPLIDSSKTDVSTNITPNQIQDLPLIGRDIADLAYLAPGVKAADSYDPTKNRYAILSVNGQGGRNVNVTVNGIDNKDNTVGGPVMQLPAEAVQEFAVSTQRFSAVNGRSEGAAINVITKSGSNGIHGSAFGFFREQAFNADQKQPDPANNGFVNSNPPYSRQFFGGSIGGPIKKDKLFAFFAIERQREHTSLAEDPAALTQLNLVTSLGAKPASVIPGPFFENRINGRMDWAINNRHSAYFSVTTQANNSLNDQSDGTFDLTESNFTVNHMQIANLTVNSALTDTLVNQFTAGFSYWNNLIQSGIRAPLITFPNAQFGTNTNVPQQSFQRKYQFKDDVTKSAGRHTFKTGVDYIWNPDLGGFFGFNPTLEIDFKKNPTCILGLGADAGKPGCGLTPLNGTIIYPNGFASPGAVKSMSQANGDPSTNVPNGTKQIGLYFQDDWKLTHRLTVNLGLRWDKDFNMIGGADIGASRTYQELVAAAPFSPLAAFLTRKKAQDDSGDFSPRVGFAFDVTGSGRHLLRGGYGLYYGNIFQNIPIFMEQQSNALIFQTALGISGTDPVPGTSTTLDKWRFGVDPFPTVPAPSGTLAVGSTGRLMDPSYRNPVTEEFNGGYAWTLSPKSVIEVEYVHVLSLHENKTVNLDPRIPVNPAQIDSLSITENAAKAPACDIPVSSGGNGCGFFRPLDAAFKAAGVNRLNTVRVDQSVGRSRYDGMNISYRQQAFHHVSLSANYTLSRAVGYDESGTSFRNYPRDPQNLFSPNEFGPAFNDERHHLTVSGIWNMPWGMEFAPILQVGSARPYNAVADFNDLNLPGGSQANALVVLNSDPTKFQAAANLTQLQAAQCYYGGKCHLNPYDNLRGDPYFNVDARLAKSLKLGEHRNLQLIFQAFNLFNHANYGNNFDAAASSATFTRPIGFINPTSTTLPRSFIAEFGARFTF
jgi:outer membrane receptor protein involved in Fe transport